MVKAFIDSSNNYLTHIYFYASYCKPCITELPTILKLHDEHREVNFLMITPESWVGLDQVKSFLRARQVNRATYILDAAVYGDEFSDVKRYHKFVEELYPGHPELSGFPLHLLLDKQHQVRYAAFGANRFNESVLDSLARAGR